MANPIASEVFPRISYLFSLSPSACDGAGTDHLRTPSPRPPRSGSIGIARNLSLGHFLDSKGEIRGRRPRAGEGFFGPLPTARRLVSALSSPRGVQGRAPTTNAF